MTMPVQPVAYARLSPAIKWLLTLTVVLLTGLEILDGTIISVSIRSMHGALAATKDQLSWMMTGYMITSAIVVLMSGSLTALFGRRRLILICVVAFGLFSMLCGFAVTPVQVIVCRMLQGAFGGLLAPMAQSMLNDLHDQESRPMANAFFGIGIMTAPVFGPILGGYITDVLSWRWDFFINIPVTAVAFVLILFFMPKDSLREESAHFDRMGFILIVIGIGCLQYVLDNGTDKGWLDSHAIVICLLLSLIAMVVFVVRGITMKESNIIDFNVIRNAPFARAMLVLFFFCMGFMGVIAWMPNFMESFLGFTATQSGLTVAPRGLASAFSMIFVPFLVRRIPVRWMLMGSFVLYIIGGTMLVGVNLSVDARFFQLANVIQGMASGLFFVPLAQEAYSTMPSHWRDTASGLFNFFRTIGGSVGIAIFSSTINHESHVNALRLSNHITPTNPAYLHWLQLHGFHSPTDPRALALVSREIARQAGAIAFADAFYYSIILFAGLLPLIYVLRWSRVKSRVR